MVNGVEQAKRDIDNVHKSFTDGHEKMLDEVNAVGELVQNKWPRICAWHSPRRYLIVNRSQKGLLEALGSPAQAIALDQLNKSQISFNSKLDLLESRTDFVLKVSGPSRLIFNAYIYILATPNNIRTARAYSNFSGYNHAPCTSS